MMSRNVMSVSEQDKHEGTTSGYVLALIVPIVFTVLLSFLINLHSRFQGRVCRFFTEFILLVYTVVFHVTVLSDFILEILAIWFILSSLAVLINIRKWIVIRDIEQDPTDRGSNSGLKAVFVRIKAKASLVEVPAKQLGYVTLLRSTILLITVVCILAVDFKIFPGYSFKTHKYGFSLMDVGIGLFVVCIAVVSNKPPMGYYCTLRNLLRLLWNICPLLVLGVGRAIIIKQIDYNQGVTEYGAHWNAFLTLGFTKLFATLSASFVPRIEYLALLAAFILGFHEAALQCGVGKFVMDRNVGRDTFFTANREGIVSIPGFIALYLVTMYLGHLLRSKSERITVNELCSKIGLFAVMSVVLWATIFPIDALFAVSRRICNLGYTVWILAILTTMSVLYMLVELFAAIMVQHKVKDRAWSYVPLIMQSINYNGLLFFLMANILTGMVNMNMDTGKADTLHSLLILMAYMLANCSVVTILYQKNWRIKFW